MKNDASFEAQLVAARPKHCEINYIFTDSVMSSIRLTEIYSNQIRKMDSTKKELFIMKLRHLPKFAIIIIAIASLAVLSGVSYATYQLLWPKPVVEVSRPTTSASGRQEVAVLLAKCGSTDIGSRFELKTNATITADEIPKVVQAQCELNAIENWARDTFDSYDGHAMRDGPPTKPFTMKFILPPIVTYIKTRSKSSITFTEQPKYGQPETTLDITPSTRFIVDGHDASADVIPNDSPVAYITRNIQRMTPNKDCNEQHCGLSEETLSLELLAVVKLSQPYRYFDSSSWQSLTEITACQGNPTDDCLTGYAGSIDLYENYGGTGSSDGQVKDIEGSIVSINGTSFTLKSSSGALFTVTTPTDIVTDFNVNRSAGYNGKTVQKGSTVIVRYMESPNLHSKFISGSSTLSIGLRLEMTGKGDPINAY